LLDVTMFWSPQGGGVQRYLRTKRRWVARRTTWCHSILVPGSDTGEVYGLPSVPLPGSGGYRFSWQRRACAAQIERLQPSVIEVGDPYRLAWSALDAGQRLGVPVIATCHSNVQVLAASVAGPWAGRAVARYLRHVYAAMDLVLAPSRWMVRQLREAGIDRVVHQPLGVDCSVFQPQRIDRRWRDALGLPPSARVLVYAGRLAQEKNLDVLLGAVELLGPPYVLVLIGSGPVTPHSSPRVRLLPYQRSEFLLAGAIAAADVFVHAGDQETFGLALLEAMACGTPVVARAASGLAELLTADAAVGVRQGTATAFAEAIRSLEGRDTAAMRAAARRHALHYDANRVFGRLFSRYAVITESLAPALRLEPEFAG
jgi:alpha-1,6-mannosyltransferase